MRIRFGPRWQATILPAAAPAGIGLTHSASTPGIDVASTTGAEAMPVVTVEPTRSSVSPFDAVRCAVVWCARLDEDAPTVVTHGPPWSAVAGPGPALPAEAFTEMPALNASRNASSTGSEYGWAPPETEKLMTSTPSRIACWIAATESDGKQPCSRQMRYMITWAPGAMPLIGPRSIPKIGALATGSPAAVEAVWVPCPFASRAEHCLVTVLQYSPGSAPNTARYVAVNA